MVNQVAKTMSLDYLKYFYYDDAEIEKDLDNFSDAQYYSTLYLGSNQDEFTFIFDTGSEWLWVPSNQ